MRLNATVAELADRLHGEVEGPSGRHLEALRALDRAGPSDLAPLLAARHEAAAAESAAGCLLVSKNCAISGSQARSVIRVADPEASLDQLTSELGPTDPGPEPGVHPSAVIDADVLLGSDVCIGPGVVLRRGARLGARCVLWANVYIGVQAVLGDDCELFPQVYLGSRTQLGTHVRIHAHACLGADGFGYRQDSAGRHIKSPQVGAVEIGDHVELGAHVTIDRGRFENTRIGAGCKLDDHVHVGHNVVFGEHCAVAGGTVFAGGVSLGNRVSIGGNSGLGGGVHMPDGSALAGMSMLVRTPSVAGFSSGIPAIPHITWKRQLRALAKLVPSTSGDDRGA